MSGLLSLPTEILQEISSLIGSDLARFRAVNRTLQLALEPVYFKSMRIDVGKPQSQLEALAIETTRAAAYIQHLEIIRGGYDEEEPLRNATKYLEPALCKLKVLRSLKWYIDLCSDQPLDRMVNRSVTECLGPLQTITTLEVIVDATSDIMSYTNFSRDLDYFINLEKFTMRFNSRSPFPAALADAVRGVIRSNAAHLTMLCIATRYSIDLKQILPESITLQQLGHLSLEGFEISEVDALPNLHSLHSLKLLKDSSSDDLWNTLRSQEIWVQKLQVSFVDTVLLDYLRSFPTLKRLSITFSEHEFMEEHLQKFLFKVLPKHSESLSSLTVRVQWSCIWPLIDSADLSTCTELIFEVPSSDIKYNGGDTLTNLLHYADRLPYLQCVTLVISGVSNRREAVLNAKIRALNAITQVRTAQRVSQVQNYIIQVQCGNSMPLRHSP